MFHKRKYRKCYDAWIAYNYCNKERAKQLNRILKYLMKGKLHRRLIKWQDGGMLVKEQGISSKQGVYGADITDMNHDLAQFQNTADQLEVEHKKTKEVQIYRGRRLLKNYMMRLYQVGIERGFGEWKKVYARHHKRDALLQQIILHYKRKQFNIIVNAFKANAGVVKRKERRAIIKEITLLKEEQESYI